ncbi:redoxin domain-containing protein [Bacillus luteolus]|uniref:Redoxin domain-containing protein n=1 Tax=Litchfieldia luteola TaxID=682179 RepID=A0ABR9QKR0_9BACI|nr:redoxin domain-containing protein [Cytobacillus luteolus]MBP1941946.1 peroxiredoxin [Cytobacillus luteolus]
MHDNFELLNDIDANMYIISADKPEEQAELYNGLEELFSYSLPFISDPEFKIIDPFNMKNNDVPYRGYALLDTDGNFVFHTVNDHWGEELEKTVAEIKEEIQGLK